MNVVDAILFSLVAIADLGLFLYLRHRRTRRIRVERMERSLRLALKRETGARTVAISGLRWFLARAS